MPRAACRSFAWPFDVLASVYIARHCSLFILPPKKGRIGRLVARASFDKPEVRITAINEPFMSIEQMAWMFSKVTKEKSFFHFLDDDI